MEFWSVEVHTGSIFAVVPGKAIVHISQAALGETENNGNESVQLYLKTGDQKLLIGTLSQGKLPQLSTEIVLEKRFELYHTWKYGSVFFCGYKVDASDPEFDDISNDELAVASDKAVAKSGAKQVNFRLPNEDVKAKQEKEEDDDDSEEESGVESDDDISSSGDDEAEESKKRATEDITSKNPASSKKAKFATQQKTESKKPHVHVATPHPSKQAGKIKNSGSNGEASKTPKSAGVFGCKSCNRSFTSEMGLQSHTKAKHSAAA